MADNFAAQIAHANALLQASRARLEALGRELRTQLDLFNAPHQAFPLVLMLAQNPQVDAANFVERVKSEMPELRDRSKAHIIELMVMVFGFYTAMWAGSHSMHDPPPEVDTAPLVNFNFFGPELLAKYNAVCDSKSVVDAAFAKAEAKALARQRQRQR